MDADPSSSRTLSARVRRERTAYDDGQVFERSSRLQARFLHVFRGPDSRRGEEAFWRRVERAAEGAVVLDYGCYDGWMMERLRSTRPRRVVGIDLAENAIQKAHRAHGLHADYQVMDAHRLGFRDESFDLVVGRAILHHLDLRTALEEIRRVLKPGGRAIFVEPLGDNPAAKLLRALTPAARTEDERPLGHADIRAGDAVFGAADHVFYNLFSVPVGMLTSLTPATPDNALLRLAHRVDSRWARGPMRHWMQHAVLDWSRR